MRRIYLIITVFILMLAVTGCNDTELVSSLSFDKSVITINVDEEKLLNYSYENIENPVFEFTLSVEEIVSLDSLGKIKGLSAGKVVITILESTSSLTDSMEVNVLAEEADAILSFTLKSVEIEIDEEMVLDFTYKNVESPVFEFTSSNEEIVVVDNIGSIKGVNNGTATITIAIVGIDVSDTIEVNVKEPLIKGPVYNITTDEELLYALAHSKDNDSFIISGVVTVDELILKNVELTINNNLTVNNFVSFSNVKILDSTGKLNYSGDITVSNNLEINSIDLKENNIKLLSNSILNIKEGAILNSVVLEEESNNIKVNNYGSLYNIDLTSSKALNNKKIVINNYGVIRDVNTGVIINDITTPENTIIKSLGSYFWIKDTVNYTNWNILENGPRYVLKNIDGETIEVLLTNKSGKLEKVINAYVELYNITSLETNFVISTEYYSLNSADFAFLKTINGLSSLNIYNTTVGKNTIPEAAFENISSLTHIELPKGLTTILPKAFAGTGITNITIPKSLANVANDAFGDYTIGEYNLHEVHTDNYEPKGLSFIRGFSPNTLFFVPEASIDDYVNEWVGISATVEYGFYYYGVYVFPEANLVDEYYVREVEEGIEIVLYDREIKENLIPSEFNINGEIMPVVSIGNNAFRFVKNNNNISVDIVMPDSITRIGDKAFLEFKTIKTLDLNNVKYIGKAAFNLISYEFTTILSPNLEYVGDDGFNGLTRVTNIDLSNVVYLGERALQSCQSLKEVYAPNLKHLGTSGLSNCLKLEKITLGGVEQCGSFTLSGSNAVKEMDFRHTEDKVVIAEFGSGWTHLNKSSVTIYCNSNVYEHFYLNFPNANIITE